MDPDGTGKRGDDIITMVATTDECGRLDSSWMSCRRAKCDVDV